MAKKFNPDLNKNVFKDMDDIARRICFIKAHLIANEFQETLTTMIRGDMFNLREDLSGKANKNKRAYQNRKKNMGGGSTPLVFRSQYVDSIKVFEDRTGPDSDGDRPESEGDHNAPRFYIGIKEYNGIHGFYVDVENIFHDPSPLNYSPLSRWFNYYNTHKEVKDEDRAGLKKQSRKTKEFQREAKMEAPHTKLVPMWWLKKALEFGVGPYANGWSMGPRYHWGHVQDMFKQKYGSSSDIWDASKEEARELIKDSIGRE
jgi:hypothetical protein